MNKIITIFKLKYIVCIAIIITILSPSLVSANSLILAPTRLVFEGKDRKSSVQVSNPSDEEVKYRVEILNRRMLGNGRYVTIETPEKDELFADRLIRVSPRSFTLAPHTSQTIRVHVRKPKNLKEGEYRSHVRVQVLPKSEKPKIGENIDGINIKVKVNYGMVIPLIIRHGKLNSDVKIENVLLEKDDDTGQYRITTKFLRDGTKSSYGDISVVYRGNKSEARILKFLPGLSVFYPNKYRSFNIPLDIPDDISIKEGTLEIIYREQTKNGGGVIAQFAKELGNSNKYE